MAKELTKTNTQTQITANVVLPEDKYALAKTIAAKGATDAEFQLLVHLSNKYELDPFQKEIWCIKRNPNDAALIMTSRDGYLTIAHRSGQFDGMNSFTVDDEKGKPLKAVCEVYRKDMTHAFRAEVKLSEYAQTNSVWNKYPSAMLIKVAEVFALKRAFRINGMVTQEEMSTDNAPSVNQEAEVVDPELDSKRQYANELIKEIYGEDKTGIKSELASLESKHGTKSSWTVMIFEEIIAELEDLKSLKEQAEIDNANNK